MWPFGLFVSMSWLCVQVWYKFCVMISQIIIIIIVIIIIINLICIAQFDTNGTLTALYIVNIHTFAICTHMNIQKQSYSYTYNYVNTSTHTPSHAQTNIYRHTNKIAHTHITNLPILLHQYCCNLLLLPWNYQRTFARNLQAEIFLHTAYIFACLMCQ